MNDKTARLLFIESLVSGYGKKQVLNGVTLEVKQTEIVALIGRNGAGKSTVLKACFGSIPIWSGAVALNGVSLKPPRPRDLLRAGVAYVPQGNRVFVDLTVRENLAVGGAALADDERRGRDVDWVFALFPALKPRVRQRAGTLSGGKKQMLALATALILSPRLLLLDEPSLGLAPPLVNEVLQRLQEVSRGSGMAILIVEQKVREVLKIANRVYVMRNGQVSYSGDAEALHDEVTLREVYL